MTELTKIVITAEDRATQTMRGVQTTAERLKGSFEAMSRAWAALGGVGVVAAFQGAMRAAMEAEESINRLNAVIKATGNVSGFTADQLHRLADEMAQTTRFDDEAFRDAIAIMLKFGNVTNDVLKRGLKSIADYAAFSKTDLSSAAEAVGRALASPAQGIDRLQRSIGYLSQAELEMVKGLEEAGDKIGAQTKLLEILEGKIGGTAEAMNTGLTKALNDLKKAWGELNEAVGNSWLVRGAVSPAIEAVAASLTKIKDVFYGENWLENAVKFFGLLNAGARLFGPQFAPEKPVGSGDPSAAQRVQDEAASRAAIEGMKRVQEEVNRHNAWMKDQEEKRAREAARVRDLDIRGWVAYIEAQRAEYERGLMAQALLTDEARAHEQRMRELDNRGWVAHIDAQTETYERGLIAQANLSKSQMQLYDEGRKLQIESERRLWTQAADLAGDFFADLVMNGKSAFDSLKRFVKQLLAEMIALFAKRWVLQLAAGATGNAQLAAQAASTGENSLAGSALSWVGTATGLTAGASAFATGFSSALLPAGAMGPTMVGASGAAGFGASMGSALSGVYSALAAIPVWGWIAMAVIAIGAWIAGNHKGGPKVGGSFMGSFDAAGNLTGPMAVPGSDNGRFFTPNQGDEALQPLVEATSKGYQQAIERLGGSGSAFSVGLGFDHDPAGTAQSRVSALLTDANGNVLYQVQDRSMDDKEVDAALQLEAQRMLLVALQNSQLPDAVSEILDSVVAAGASAEEIQAVIAAAVEMRQVLDGLAALDLNGLDIDALKAWQREGETIGQAFQRVAGQFATFREMFMSDAEKIDFAQQNVNAAFEALGVAVPESNRAFLDLVESIDLSTEAGRDMWDALVAIAPAFQAVQNAAASALAEFDELMGRLRPGYSASQSAAALAGNLSSFRAGNPWAAGLTDEQLISQLLTIQRGDFGNYSRGNQNLILSILGAVGGGGDLGGAGSELAPGRSFGSFANANLAAAEAARELAEALKDAKASLGQYLDSLLLNKELSPLSATERLDQAKKEYERLLELAQGGDLNAMGKLAGAHSLYLQIAREVFGSSSPYIDIFTKTFNEIAGVAGVEDYNERMLASSESQVEAAMAQNAKLDDVRVLLNGIFNANYANTAAINGVAREGFQRLETAIVNRGIASERA